ncbi:hypothetical protein GCM10011316_29880 [Roseibium aquae]|uniref:Uncharacterized protein n=1 Tax=Roseibium aquae TaxID=1323746 RepID=A0A916TM17_9HYPH|nr:hypothetical protein [Roseibium aquae]GGB55822.1 hypothetical protein GCM10011316_29880 [Roseibium aquae]
MITRSILLMALLAGAARAEPVLPCPGTYDARWGNVTLAADGTMVLAGTPGSSRITLSLNSCDSADISGDGQSLTLTRQGPDHFRGELAGGGANRQFDFQFLGPGQASSIMNAEGGGLTGRRGMSLLLVEPGDLDDKGCFDAPPVPTSLPREAVAAELWAKEQGLVPAPGHGAQDYIDARTSFDARRDGVAHRVSFDLGINGEILPSSGAKDRWLAHCDPELFLNPPRQMLNFKIFELAPGVSVFAQIIDIQTGQITAQAEGQADDTDAAAVAAAMARASAGLDKASIGPMSDRFSRR